MFQERCPLCVQYLAEAGMFDVTFKIMGSITKIYTGVVVNDSIRKIHF